MKLLITLFLSLFSTFSHANLYNLPCSSQKESLIRYKDDLGSQRVFKLFLECSGKGKILFNQGLSPVSWTINESTLNIRVLNKNDYFTRVMKVNSRDEFVRHYVRSISIDNLEKKIKFIEHREYDEFNQTYQPVRLPDSQWMSYEVEKISNLVPLKNKFSKRFILSSDYHKSHLYEVKEKYENESDQDIAHYKVSHIKTASAEPSFELKNFKLQLKNGIVHISEATNYIKFEGIEKIGDEILCAITKKIGNKESLYLGFLLNIENKAHSIEYLQGAFSVDTYLNHEIYKIHLNFNAELADVKYHNTYTGFQNNYAAFLKFDKVDSFQFKLYVLPNNELALTQDDIIFCRESNECNKEVEQERFYHIIKSSNRGLLVRRFLRWSSKNEENLLEVIRHGGIQYFERVDMM